MFLRTATILLLFFYSSSVVAKPDISELKTFCQHLLARWLPIKPSDPKIRHHVENLPNDEYEAIVKFAALAMMELRNTHSPFHASTYERVLKQTDSFTRQIMALRLGFKDDHLIDAAMQRALESLPRKLESKPKTFYGAYAPGPNVIRRLSQLQTLYAMLPSGRRQGFTSDGLSAYSNLYLKVGEFLDAD